MPFLAATSQLQNISLDQVDTPHSVLRHFMPYWHCCFHATDKSYPNANQRCELWTWALIRTLWQLEGESTGDLVNPSVHTEVCDMEAFLLRDLWVWLPSVINWAKVQGVERVWNIDWSNAWPVEAGVIFAQIYDSLHVRQHISSQIGDSAASF